LRDRHTAELEPPVLIKQTGAALTAYLLQLADVMERARQHLARAQATAHGSA
jgi:hypothetical protein